MLWVEWGGILSGMVALATLCGKLVHLIQAIQRLIDRVEVLQRDIGLQRSDLEQLKGRLYQLEGQLIGG